MSLGDLANGSPEDATDFATEIGGGHSGVATDFAMRTGSSGRIMRQLEGPPGGVAERPLGQSINPICLMENFWLIW
jgi:hypothetical protein